MTTPTLAIERLFDAVAARFDDEAGTVSALETASFHGTASIAGSPTAAAEVRIKFPTGGTVGVDGIVYRVSTDDGATYGSPVDLGVSDTIEVSGVTATVAGDILADDVLRWVQTSPRATVFAFGTREPAKRGDFYRIVFVPGDDSGALGTVSQSRQPGRNPRPLLTLDELVSVYVEGFDTTAGKAEDERAQWKGTRLLLDAFLRALYLAAAGTYEIVDLRWLVDRSTRRHGYTARVVLAVQSMIPDAPFYAMTAAASATTSTVESAADGAPVIRADDPDTIEGDSPP